jgi:hypothetical protein
MPEVKEIEEELEEEELAAFADFIDGRPHRFKNIGASLAQKIRTESRSEESPGTENQPRPEENVRQKPFSYTAAANPQSAYAQNAYTAAGMSEGVGGREQRRQTGLEQTWGPTLERATTPQQTDNTQRDYIAEERKKQSKDNLR